MKREPRLQFSDADLAEPKLEKIFCINLFDIFVHFPHFPDYYFILDFLVDFLFVLFYNPKHKTSDV